MEIVFPADDAQVRKESCQLVRDRIAVEKLNMKENFHTSI